MSITDKKLTQLVDMIAKEIRAYDLPNDGAQDKNHLPSSCPVGVFNDVDAAVQAAKRAQRQFCNLSMHDRKVIIQSIRTHLTDHVEILAKHAVTETGMGRIADKILKNQVALEKTPGIEELQVSAWSGDHGLTLVELSPFGLIGAVTPATNPTETIIGNSIGMIAAGNGVVFSPHPQAYAVSNFCVGLINEAVTRVGGPLNLVTSIDQPSMEKVNQLLTHPQIDMLCVTGGRAVVKAALSTGKKAIGAGAGNPPVLVDESADIEQAAKDIVAGSSFDNNLPCIAEKEAIVVDSVADYLLFNMQKHGAYLLSSSELIKQLEALIIQPNGTVNRQWIGRDAHLILREIGLSVSEDIRLIILETDKHHPFVQQELMMPILPIIRVKNALQGINLACELEQGNHHTAICHSKNVDVLTEMGQRIQTTIFVKNGPSYTGLGVDSEGYCSFTIAGSTGEGMTSTATFTRRRRCVLVNGLNIR